MFVFTCDLIYYIFYIYEKFVLYELMEYTYSHNNILKYIKTILVKEKVKYNVDLSCILFSFWVPIRALRPDMVS